MARKIVLLCQTGVTNIPIHEEERVGNAYGVCLHVWFQTSATHEDQAIKTENESLIISKKNRINLEVNVMECVPLDSIVLSSITKMIMSRKRYVSQKSEFACSFLLV